MTVNGGPKPLWKSRTFYGLIASGLWLAFVGWLVYLRLPDGPMTYEVLKSVLLRKELNALGDFFAGAFAPLAFLWLVLGYLQQGEELRNSQDALLLQAKELNESVQAQRGMLKVAEEEARERKAAWLKNEEPSFRVDLSEERLTPGHFNVVFRNDGGRAFDVIYGYGEGKEQGLHSERCEVMNHMASCLFRWVIGSSAYVFIEYSDRFGVRRTIKTRMPTRHGENVATMGEPLVLEGTPPRPDDPIPYY